MLGGAGAVAEGGGVGQDGHRAGEKQVHGECGVRRLPPDFRSPEEGKAVLCCGKQAELNVGMGGMGCDAALHITCGLLPAMFGAREVSDDGNKQKIVIFLGFAIIGDYVGSTIL